MPRPTIDREGAWLAIIVVSSWAFPGVFVRLMPQLMPWTVATLRLSVGFLTVLPIAVTPRYRAGFFAAAVRLDCWAVALCMFVYYLVATAAFQNAPVGEVALFIASAPALVLPIRWLMGTRPTAVEGLGTALALAGVALVLKPGGPRVHYEHPELGPILALSAAACSACFAIGVRKLADAAGPPSGLAMSTLAFAFGPLALPFFLRGTSHAAFFDIRTLWALPLGAVSTALPTVCYAAASGRVPPVVATMLNPLAAICANIVAAIAIGEHPRIWVIPGGVLVIAGIYTLTRPSREVNQAPDEPILAD